MDDDREKTGLDKFIKWLTALKLFVQLAFYGLLLGGTIWFLLHNPIPGLLQKLQTGLFGNVKG